MKCSTYFALLLILGPCFLVGCRREGPPNVVAVSGVKEIRPEVHTGVDGFTNEQRNIRDRYKMDSEPGSIKHLYLISAYTGDVLLYSTVRGKVTSSGKRLSPTTVATGSNSNGVGPYYQGIPFDLNGVRQYTGEVLQDDGTYGSSIEYLYFFDSQKRYHQIYPAAGTLIYISNQPAKVKKPVLSIEEVKE